MNAVLICPAERPALSFLSTRTSLANLPLMGQTLLEYWLSHLAAAGAERVLVLVKDRPEHAKALLGSGTRWGLSVNIVVDAQELTPQEVLAKYGNQVGTPSRKVAVEILDHFPGLSRPTLFGGYAEFFHALQMWMPHAITPDRVGMRQVCPGIWCGANSRISSEARLEAPCWIGQRAVIRRGAVLGPGSIVEDGAFIDTEAEVTASWIAPHTFVGRLARVGHSLAWGDSLINWQTGSATQVADPFVLSALWQPQRASRLAWFRRLGELYFRQKPEPDMPWKEFAVAEQQLTHESCPEH